MIIGRGRDRDCTWLETGLVQGMEKVWTRLETELEDCKHEDVCLIEHKKPMEQLVRKATHIAFSIEIIF
jgi:hypothetical protein